MVIDFHEDVFGRTALELQLCESESKFFLLMSLECDCETFDFKFPIVSKLDVIDCDIDFSEFKDKLSEMEMSVTSINTILSDLKLVADGVFNLKFDLKSIYNEAKNVLLLNFPEYKDLEMDYDEILEFNYAVIEELSLERSNHYHLLNL